MRDRFQLVLSWLQTQVSSPPEPQQTINLFFFLTFLVLCDDWVAELSELSSPNLVDGLDSEVVLSVGDEIFNIPAHLVLSRHHVDIRPPASFTALHVNHKPNDQFSPSNQAESEIKPCHHL